MVLKIRKLDLDNIFQHTKKCYPKEACGILLGRKIGEQKNVEKVCNTRNILDSASEYQIDPTEQLKIFKEAEREGLDILGFYHSHPFLAPFWSETDNERSKLWKGYSYLIVSPKSSSFKSYVKKENIAEKEEVTIL